MRSLYSCEIRQADSLLLYKEFRTLADIASELKVPYQFIADISSRKGIKHYQQFIYYPTIKINKL